MDIFEQITEEHREVDGILQQLSEGYDRQLIKRLRIYFVTHMGTEEATIYAAVKDRELDLVTLAEEHKRIKGLLVNLGAVGPDEFPSKLAALAEAIREHVSKEEQDVLAKTRQALDQEKVDSLSYQFNEINRRKRESVL